jgi:hypothetical protein
LWLWQLYLAILEYSSFVNPLLWRGFGRFGAPNANNLETNRVGVFATLTNSYALVAVGASENFYRYVHDMSILEIIALKYTSCTRGSQRTGPQECLY